MRIAALVLAILGSLASGGFAVSVLTDSRVDQAEKAMARAKAMGINLSSGYAAKVASAAKRAIYGAWALLAAFVLGIVGGILAFKGIGKIAGPLMLIGALIPGFLQPLYFIFTALLIIGGILAFFAKPKGAARGVHARPVPA
ncbi:MAG: hypothetical protein KC503_14990 [Myxococcales bacterium]|nr:hypothetical protein [Myxococcales bacterium]